MAYGRFISCGGAEKSDDAVAVVAVDRSDDAVAQRKGEGGSFDCSSWLRESGARWTVRATAAGTIGATFV